MHAPENRAHRGAKHERWFRSRRWLGYIRNRKVSSLLDMRSQNGRRLCGMNAIVVGTDGSPGAEAAVLKVIELARGTDATVHLVSAYPGRSTLARIGMSAKQEQVDLRGVAYDVVARDEHRF